MFSTPWLLFVDSLRLLLIVGGLVLLWFISNRLMQAWDHPQRARFVAFGLAVLTLEGDQIERLGNPEVSWRISLHALVVVIGLFGTIKYDPLQRGPR